MLLESLGAGEQVFGAFQIYAAQGLLLGRVALSQRDHYHLYTESGELAAEPSGALLVPGAGPRLNARGW